jgi:hypothetical protein
MANSARNTCIILFGGGALLLLEYAISRFIPPLGIVFYIPTLIGLSVLEDSGLPTLQGSPDGWPMATTYGVYIAAISWWLLWSLVLAAILWRWHRRNKP